MRPADGFLPIGQVSPYMELTITMRDKVTGVETTIMGTVKDLVIAMPVTYESPPPPYSDPLPGREYRHVNLSGEWVLTGESNGYYTISILDELTLPSPDQPR